MFFAQTANHGWGYVGNVNTSVLRKSAISSGLLTEGEIETALESLKAGSNRPGKPISDTRLASKLIAMGKINQWQAKQLLAGRTKFTLGPYRVIDSIGAGGMGEVYKAEHTVMGREVAIKVLPRSRSSPEAIANFLKEIRTQAQLDHENLVRAYDAGQDGNVHFLVTEYVPGTDLRRLIRKEGKLSIQEAAYIMYQAARGLEYAHSRGLVHRDIKPGNVLVTPEGKTKLSDLGLAEFFDEETSVDSATPGKVVGTADYLPPEVILGTSAPTPLGDIYSLGCTLYYTVTGKVPFPGGSTRDKARNHVKTPPLDPRRLNPDLDDDFVDLIADMIAKNPSERTQTAAEVAKRLEPWGKVGAQAKTNAAVMAKVASQLSSQLAGFPDEPGPAMGGDAPLFVPPGFEPNQDESPSQSSMGTHPLASFSEETIPFLSNWDSRREFRRKLNSSIWPDFKFFGWLGVIAVVSAILAIVIKFAFF